MNAWLDHNMHSLGLALWRLRSAPLASLFTILVIGIALALPTGFYVALVNIDRLAGGVASQPEITLFLKTGLDETAGRQLAARLGKRADIAGARFVSRDEGLKRLQDSGLADVTAGLAGNPLPDTLTLAPRDAQPAAMEALSAELKLLPEVEQVAMDSDWVRRLDALLGFGRDLVWLLAGLLGLALTAIVGNTIRLQIYALREEIEVSRLIGATDRFIRRPFLYFGALQGLLGGLAGWVMVAGALSFLESSLGALAAAWGSRLQLQGPGPLEGTALLAIAALLGLIGAYLAVSRTLRQFD